MIMNKVTITGADDHVDRNVLYELSDKYPFVEWGILYHSDKEGTPRYPSDEWVEKFDKWAPSFVNSGVHLCGSDAADFCDGDLSIVRYSAYGSPSYNSIQVNVPGEYSISSKADEIADLFIRSSKCISTVIQMNDYTRPIVESLQKKEDGNFVNILFDQSRGKGIYQPIKWNTEMHKLLGRSRCGFAGGISPDNCEMVSKKIMHLSNLHYNVESEILGYLSPPSTWIDMESGVRTDNEFDLEKVEIVLKKMEPFVNGYGA